MLFKKISIPHSDNIKHINYITSHAISPIQPNRCTVQMFFKTMFISHWHVTMCLPYLVPLGHNQA